MGSFRAGFHRFCEGTKASNCSREVKESSAINKDESRSAQDSQQETRNEGGGVIVNDLHVRWLTNYYSFLLDAKVTKVEMREDEDGLWPTITIEKDGEVFEIEISRDEEGNGPGFIHGLPFPQ